MSNSLPVAQIVHQRKTTKAFEPGCGLTLEQSAAVRELLRMAPSSTNAQPWHFVIAKTDAGKARIATGTTGNFAYNEPKINNATEVIVLCARTRLDDAYLTQVLDQETQDGRLVTEEARTNQHNMRKGYVQKHEAAGSVLNWGARQVYIALGFLLLGAAEIGVDACPIEGFDGDAVDAALGLTEQGLKSVVLVALGHKSAADFNAALPKSRLPASQVITDL
jgi:nitroreductase/dihydropteridine reductase